MLVQDSHCPLSFSLLSTLLLIRIWVLQLSIFNVDAIHIESMVFLLLILRYSLPFSFSFDGPPFLFFSSFGLSVFYFFLSSTIVNAHDCNTLLHVFVVCPRKLWFLFMNFALVSIELMFVFGFHNIALLKVWILVKFVWSLSFYCFLLCL